MSSVTSSGRSMRWRAEIAIVNNVCQTHFRRVGLSASSWPAHACRRRYLQPRLGGGGSTRFAMVLAGAVGLVIALWWNPQIQRNVRWQMTPANRPQQRIYLTRLRTDGA